MAADTCKNRTGQDENAGHPRRWWVLLVMSLASFVIVTDNTIVNTALPSIARDLQASNSQLQWIVDSYAVMLAGLLLVGGTIGDVFGRKRWFAVGLGIFATGATVAALSSGSNQLIAGRALQGLGGALIMPATLSILTNVFSREERTKAIGIWTGVAGLAIGVGPGLGGYIVDNASWATVFWLHLPAIALIAVGLLVVPESRDPRPRRLDVRGALLGTAGLTSLVFAIIQGGESGWTAPVVLLSAALSAVALALFALVECRTEYPMLPLRFFKERDFTAAVVIIGLVYFTVAVTFFFLTQYYQLVQGRSAFEAGLLSVPCAVAMAIGAPLAGIMVKRFGPRVLIVSGMAVLALGMALLAQLDVESSTLHVSAIIFLFGLAGGLALVPLTDTVMAAVPVEEAGMASAVNDVTRELGSALGIAIIGTAVSSIYRTSLEQDLAGSVPPEALHSASDGMGAASALSNALPPEVAHRLMEAANTAFVHAVGQGFLINAALLAIPIVAGALLLPNRIRQHQAESGPATPEDLVAPAAELHPDGATAALQPASAPGGAS